jgi:hypothetical protein
MCITEAKKYYSSNTLKLQRQTHQSNTKHSAKQSSPCCTTETTEEQMKREETANPNPRFGLYKRGHTEEQNETGGKRKP